MSLKADRSKFRIGFLLHAIGHLLANPLSTDEYFSDLSKYRKEFHTIAGNNPIFIPKHTKLKGYIKDVKRNNNYNKFRKYK